jgi:NhaA family Na+:H+ antiporter
VTPPPARLVAEKILNTLQRFLHVEAVSGIVWLIAAATALVWANSPAAHSYHALWGMPLTVSVGTFSVSHPLHFIVNDALMSTFFLVAGRKIRREIYEGALAELRVAALSLAGVAGLLFGYFFVKRSTDQRARLHVAADEGAH